MDSLDWNDPLAVNSAKTYFDSFLTAWNPRPAHLRVPAFHRASHQDPCTLPASSICEENHANDYETLVNSVQRHTKCNEFSCLRKKGSNLVCRYGFPFDLQETSSMFIDSSGQKKYSPARNDPLLNVHNPLMLSVWRANVDCQPVLSRHAVLSYISKYASKAESKSESYHDILTRISHAAPAEEGILLPIRKLLSETVADRDIGAQETCHMLQKIPLTLCSHTFLSLNTSQTIFKRVSLDLPNTPHQPTSFLHTCKDPLCLNTFPFSKLPALGIFMHVEKNVNGSSTN